MPTFPNIITICFVIIHIRGQNILCNDAKECKDQIVSTDSDNYVSCSGALSCNHASNISTNMGFIYCSGSNACSDINGSSVMTSSTNILCHALDSCSYSNIKGNSTSPNVYCYGHLSCANSYILSARLVAGYAAYSLYNTTIEGVDGELIISLYGYNAGYGATIICHYNATCTIDCYSNACYMTFVDCEEGAKCYISIKTNDAIPPITNISRFDSSVSLQHLFEDETINNDRECNNNSMSFDIYKERYNFNEPIDTKSDQYICCRGEESCRRNNIIHVGNTTDAKLICGGSASCSYSNIRSNNVVSCEGSRSCNGPSHINTTNNIQCLAYRSCVDSTIHNAINITCSGYESCLYVNIYTSGLGEAYNMYLIGWNAAAHSNIHCKTNDECFILCSAQFSCNHITLICDGICSVECAQFSCYDTTLICDGICSVECDEASDCPVISNSSTATIAPTETTVSLTGTMNDTTFNPLESTETSNIFGIRILFEFKYEIIAVNVSINITQKTETILNDIIYDEIYRNFADEMIDNCIGNIDDMIINETGDGVITVNVVIPTCNEAVEQQLLIIYSTDNTLQTDFIDKVERENHLSVIGEIHITFDYINPTNIDSTNIDYIESTNIDHEYDENNNNKMFIIFGSIGCVFGMCLISFIAFKCYKRYKTKQLQKQIQPLESVVASSEKQTDIKTLYDQSAKNNVVNMMIGEAGEVVNNDIIDKKGDDTSVSSDSDSLYVKSEPGSPTPRTATAACTAGNGEDEESVQSEGVRKITKNDSVVNLENNKVQDENEDVILVEVSSDVMEMEKLDTNKIQEMNEVDVINEKANTADSNKIDDIYMINDTVGGI